MNYKMLLILSISIYGCLNEDKSKEEIKAIEKNIEMKSLSLKNNEHIIADLDTTFYKNINFRTSILSPTYYQNEQVKKSLLKNFYKRMLRDSNFLLRITYPSYNDTLSHIVIMYLKNDFLNNKKVKMEWETIMGNYLEFIDRDELIKFLKCYD